MLASSKFGGNLSKCKFTAKGMSAQLGIHTLIFYIFTVYACQPSFNLQGFLGAKYPREGRP